MIMGFGKRVYDLDIDSDAVLLSSDISAVVEDVISDSKLDSTVIGSENFNDALANAVEDAVQSIQITDYIDIGSLSDAVKDSVKSMLDDYVLKRMLSTMVFDIISTYNNIVIDCLDGSPDGNADIDAGGAY